MNDATKQALNDFILKLVQGLDTAATFTAEQTPLLVQEYLDWIFWSSLLGAVASIAGLMIAAAVFRWTRNYYKMNPRSNNPGPGFTCAAAAVLSIPLTLNTIYCAAFVLKVSVAPRLVIIEGLKGLL